MSTNTFISQTLRISTSNPAKPWALKSVRRSWETFNRCTSSLPGSGAGKGGGGGGSVKDAGGGLGRFATAQEEGYFYHQEKEKLSKLKKQLKDNPGLYQKEKKPDNPYDRRRPNK